MLARERKIYEKNPLLEFFSVYFKNLHRVVAVNLLFLLFSLPAIALQIVLYLLIRKINIFSVLLFTVTAFPFSGGLTVCSRKLAMGDNFNIANEYFNATRENTLHMLKHSLIADFAILIEYLSLTAYYRLANGNAVYWTSFAVSVILGIFMLFCSYSVVIMATTYELKLKQVYKNAALLTVGAFKYNILATFALGFFAMTVLTVSMIFGGMISAVLLVLMTVVLVPASVCVIVSFILFPKIRRDMENASRRDFQDANKGNDGLTESDFSEIPGDLLKGDAEEFVFFNGRMYKRSALVKLKQENDFSDSSKS